MPVSYLPCFMPLLLVGIPLLLLFKSRRAAGIAGAVSASLLIIFLLSIYVPGWILHSRAAAGNPAAQYRYAQWLENHCERVNVLILWPCSPDVLEGHAWLERAAAQDHPPAVWLVGVRLKYGEHVPKPPDWTGPAGNFFPQPERGQEMIDRAIHELGYSPPHEEERFYWHHYRRGLAP